MAEYPVEYIKDLAAAGDVEALQRIAASEGKRLNQRFRRLEQSGKADSSTAYYFATRELGIEKPRYKENVSGYRNWQINDLYDTILDIQQKLQADTTKAVLAQYESNRIDAAVDKIERVVNSQRFSGLKNKQKLLDNLSAEKFKDFVNNGGSELLNTKELDSWQIIEDFLRFTQGNTTIGVERFVNAYVEYHEKHASYDVEGINKRLKRERQKVYNKRRKR